MVKQSLSCATKHAVVASILTKQSGATLKMAWGSAKKMSADLSVTEQSVKRVWREYVNQKRSGVLVPDLSPKFNERGRKSKLTPLHPTIQQHQTQQYAAHFVYQHLQHLHSLVYGLLSSIYLRKTTSTLYLLSSLITLNPKHLLSYITANFFLYSCDSWT